MAYIGVGRQVKNGVAPLQGAFQQLFVAHVTLHELHTRIGAGLVDELAAAS